MEAKKGQCQIMKIRGCSPRSFESQLRAYRNPENQTFQAAPEINEGSPSKESSQHKSNKKVLLGKGQSVPHPLAASEADFTAQIKRLSLLIGSGLAVPAQNRDRRSSGSPFHPYTSFREENESASIGTYL